MVNVRTPLLRGLRSGKVIYVKCPIAFWAMGHLLISLPRFYAALVLVEWGLAPGGPAIPPQLL